jgi:hypothetical protein
MKTKLMACGMDCLLAVSTMAFAAGEEGAARSESSYSLMVAALVKMTGMSQRQVSAALEWRGNPRMSHVAYPQLVRALDHMWIRWPYLMKDVVHVREDGQVVRGPRLLQTLYRVHEHDPPGYTGVIHPHEKLAYDPGEVRATVSQPTMHEPFKVSHTLAFGTTMTVVRPNPWGSTARAPVLAGHASR